VCDELVAELGMRRRIRVLTSVDGSGPLSFGVMAPVILLPRDLPAFGRGALRRALLHEIEHVRRLDWLTYALARIVCAAYWFHPLVWATFRRLRLDAESACDDCVVQHEQSGVEYASLLVAVAERDRSRYRPALAMAASSELGARVAAVLDNQQERGPASRSTVLGAAAAALSIAVLLSSPIVIDARSTVGEPSAVVQEAPPATFEVASIKRNTLPGVETTLRVDPGGRLTAVGAPLLWLIAGAYGNAAGALRYEQVVGAPRWLQDERYDVIAQVADAAALGEPATFITMRPSLRALLEDRFKLKTHRESRQRPIYALVRLGKGSGFGPGFARSTVDCSKDQTKCGSGGGPVGHIKAEAVTSDILMQMLAYASGRLVVDRTGLEGPFVVDLEWSQDPAASDKPSIFTAVQEQLGLKLESTRGPVDILVIDHVERPTAD
jgi:uncharacterized protein (TIGR03435 family)